MAGEQDRGAQGLSEVSVGAWRKAPDAADAIAMCAAVTSADAERVRPVALEFAREARAQHRNNPGVLVAVARMCLVIDALHEAQSTLVAASGLAPEEPRIFALLGQVLLRLGDARRAVTAFEQAAARGLTGPATRALHDKARDYLAVQEARGEEVVAAEIKRALCSIPPRPPSERPATDSAAPRPGSTPRTGLRWNQGAGSSAPPPPRIPPLGPPPNAARTLMGLGGEGSEATGIDFAPREVDTILTNFADEAEGKASGPRGVKSSPVKSRSSPPPPAPAARRATSKPPVEPSDKEVGSRYTLIQPGRIDVAATDRRSGRPVRRPSSGPAVHRDHGVETREAARGASEVPRGSAGSSDPAPRRAAARADAHRATAEPSLGRRALQEVRDHDGPAVREAPPAASTQRDGSSPSTHPAPDVTPVASARYGAVSSDRGGHAYGGLPPGPLEPPVAVAPPSRDGVASVRPPRSKWRRYGLPVGLLLCAALGIEAGRVLERAETHRASGQLVDEALAALHVGSPRALVEADAILRRARDADPQSREVAVAVMHGRILHMLDVDESGAGLAEAVAAARALGVPENLLATGEIAMALVAKDARRIDELLVRHDADRVRSLSAVAFYELSAAAALERRGDPRAVERYQAAVRADPSLFPAEVRLVRAMLLSAEPSEGGRRARALPAGRPETVVLSALASRVTEPEPQSPAAPVQDDLPRTLKSLARALELASGGTGQRRGPAFSAAVTGTDVPAAAVRCGHIALEAGEAEAAHFAAQRALELAPTFAPALMLLGRAALAEGHVQRLKQAADRLGGREGAELRAIHAYEVGDYAQLEEIVRTMRPPAAPDSPLRLAVERVRGATFEGSRLDAAVRADPVWGPMVAVDAALDAGDFGRERELSAAWEEGSKHPLRALRVARRSRYLGRLDEARRALDLAAPTEAALHERALLAGELRAERVPAASALEAATGPERPFLLAYVRARQGTPDKAKKLLSATSFPGKDAPAPQRLAAALAHAEVASDDRAAKWEAKRMLALWPDNPDVMRAAVGFGLLPRSSLRPPSAAAGLPTSPPREDPYR